LVPKLQTKHRLITIFLLLSVLITVQAGVYFLKNTNSQNNILKNQENPDTTITIPSTGSLKDQLPDTLNTNVSDTALVSPDTTIVEEKVNKFMLGAKIDYSSAD
jgi:cell division protein YceG involved in septum cleavage